MIPSQDCHVTYVRVGLDLVTKFVTLNHRDSIKSNKMQSNSRSVCIYLHHGLDLASFTRLFCHGWVQ